jgi:hypothetical protein
MVNISDMAMLAAGICVGRLIFAPSMRMHLISRLLAAYPCYGVVWFEIDKIGHFATTEIASPDQIILYFTGVGMIWGSATRIWPAAFRAARILGGCLLYKAPNKGEWILRTLPVVLAGVLITCLTFSTIADAKTIATETLAQYLSGSAAGRS